MTGHFPLEDVELGVVGVPFEFDGHHEVPAAAFPHPLQHQSDAAFRRGDHIAEQPVHRGLWHEAERIALVEGHARAPHEILAQR